ncbi:MAG TPA: response regulator transcription factor [Candidatus Dormibacteraeota bacterium]|nr:response regulator transcription factor [Candidatus Dormibacteraeota bacterium]
MIRVLVADDHPVVRQGLCAMLAAEPDLEVVGDVGDGGEAVARTLATRPDVVLMDVQMPVLDGIEALKEIMRLSPATKVVMLTTFGHENYVVPSFKAGAAGYLLKDVDRSELTDAIRRVAEGESLLELPDDEATAAAAISRRELEVLACMAGEMTNREIAASLFLSEQTVKTHVSHILAKLGASDRSGAVLRAWKRGLLPTGLPLNGSGNHPVGG